jgi:hypothetical protein
MVLSENAGIVTQAPAYQKPAQGLVSQVTNHGGADPDRRNRFPRSPVTTAHTRFVLFQ